MGRGSRQATVISCLALLSACGTDATEVLIAVDTDLAIPGAIDAVRIEVTSPEGALKNASADLVGSPLPVVLGLVHDDGPLGPFTVVARGTSGGGEVIARTARFSFQPERTLVLRMDLFADCLGVDCGAEGTCGAEGCRSVDVAPAELVEYDGPIGRLTPDAGAGEDAGTMDGGRPDTGSPMDAARPDARSVDSGRLDADVPDGGGPIDAGGPDTGPACPVGCNCAPDCDGTCSCDSCPCASTCAGNRSCAMTCDGSADCSIDCSGNAQCDVACRGTAACLQRCTGGATCTMSECAAGATSCPGGVTVCNRACP